MGNSNIDLYELKSTENFNTSIVTPIFTTVDWMSLLLINGLLPACKEGSPKKIWSLIKQDLGKSYAKTLP